MVASFFLLYRLVINLKIRSLFTHSAPFKIILLAGNIFYDAFYLLLRTPLT